MSGRACRPAEAAASGSALVASVLRLRLDLLNEALWSVARPLLFQQALQGTLMMVNLRTVSPEEILQNRKT